MSKATKSKRVSFGKRLKIARKVREQFRKDQKKKRNHARQDIRVPSNILLTAAQKEHLDGIKQSTKQRNEEYKAEHIPADAESPMALLAECIGECDTVVEVVDYRDMSGTRSPRGEQAVLSAGKKLFVWLSHYDESLGLDYSQLETQGMQVIKEGGFFSGRRNICVFGGPKTGKYYLRSLIESLIEDATVKTVSMPLEHIGLSAVLRGAVSVDQVDPVMQLGRVLSGSALSAMVDHYMLPPSGSLEELLVELGRRATRDRKESHHRTRETGARWLIRDVIKSGTGWAMNEGRVSIKWGV